MRLIDADELKIDFGFTWDDIAPTREEMFEIIDRQPTAEPKTGRWIPVSERLPEDVLCGTLVTDGIDVWPETWVGIVGKWKYNHSTITAWMPLPEPYEGRREADETD